MGGYGSGDAAVFVIFTASNRDIDADNYDNNRDQEDKEENTRKLPSSRLLHEEESEYMRTEGLNHHIG